MHRHRHRHRLPTKPLHFHIKRTILCRISTLRRYLRSFWNRFLACSMLKSCVNRRHYQPSPAAAIAVVYSSSSASPAAVMRARSLVDRGRDSSDLVPLKISVFGDPHIGKTSFLTKYAGVVQGKKEQSTRGINQVDKTLDVKGARISYSVWEVGGDSSSFAHIPVACKDSVAILFMFDLTSRCTLNSVIRWYNETRKWNQTAIPVLVGTKFDDFVQLPMDLQWTIAKEARSYAKALNATLFFSSATYNINVNKIFKFITAKLFNLEWNLERNLTVGEPIIDF